MSLDLSLRTERLFLRPFRDDDADGFQSLAGHWEVARMTSDIRHPLTAEDARQWLTPSPGEVRLAIELEGRLIGGTGYFERDHGAMELGFWLGRDWWGRGFATEAARAVLRYGFEHGDVERFTSAHFIDNPASGRVLAKLGFEPIGQVPMWSIARRNEVQTRLYELTRAQAGYPPLPTRGRTVGGLSALFERVRGAS